MTPGTVRPWTSPNPDSTAKAVPSMASSAKPRRQPMTITAIEGSQHNPAPITTNQNKTTGETNWTPANGPRSPATKRPPNPNREAHHRKNPGRVLLTSSPFTPDFPRFIDPCATLLEPFLSAWPETPAVALHP